MFCWVTAKVCTEYISEKALGHVTSLSRGLGLGYELSSLGGLPQYLPVVIGIVFTLTLCRGHSRKRVPAERDKA